MSEPGRILWGAGTGRTIRAHWALKELGLAYESRPIGARTGETHSADYVALNPRRKIPLLQDGGLTIGESAAIAAYLGSRYATSTIRLVPEESHLHAKWLEWCFFIVTELDSTSLYIIRRHHELKHIYGEAPGVVEQAAEYFRNQLVFVDKALCDGRAYLVGSCFSTADILLTTCLRWAKQYGIEIGTTPDAYLGRMLARRAYIEADEANSAAIALSSPLEQRVNRNPTCA